MRVAMLTCGGDCPGLNAVMRAVVRKGEGVYGDQMVGLRYGSGLDSAEVAQLLGISEGSVRTRLWLVLGRLRGAMIR